MKESPYSASPSRIRAELNSKQNTPNTCDTTMAKRYMNNITETKEQWNKNFFTRSGIFLCKKVLGLSAKNRQFWSSSSASTVRSVYVVFVAYQFSKWLQKVVQSLVNTSSQVSDLRCAFFNDDRTLIHLLWHELYTHCHAHTATDHFPSAFAQLSLLWLEFPSIFAHFSLRSPQPREERKRKKTVVSL